MAVLPIDWRSGLDCGNHLLPHPPISEYAVYIAPHVPIKTGEATRAPVAGRGKCGEGGDPASSEAAIQFPRDTFPERYISSATNSHLVENGHKQKESHARNPQTFQ